MTKVYRAGVIGSTKRGGYGHGLDTVYRGLDGVELVAVADDDAEGLKVAGKRLGVANLYRDYRAMLAKEKLDLVSICPRWVDDRVAMTEAAAGAGCHIYCEKPLAADLADADAMLAACDKAKVQVAVAHQLRALPPVQAARQNLKAGKYGKLLRIRSRPKDDHRGGGEELVVHGTHMMDLMVYFAGAPRWVSGHVQVGEREATRQDRHTPTEPLGPVAGDSVTVLYGFDHGVRGYFDSTVKLDQPGKTPYGVLLECTEALVHVRPQGEVFVYPAAVVVPENPKLTWERLWIQDWHFTPDHKPRPLNDYIHRANQVIVRDLLDAAARGRKPLTSGHDARLALEMIQGTYASHFDAGRRVPVPQPERRHPLK